MIYTRGTKADYDAWAALGHPDWSYDKLLPYFVKSETSLDYQNSFYHGNTVIEFIAIPDCNAPDTPSKEIAILSLTLNECRECISTSEAFLSKKIVLERQNLTICINILVSRIVFRHNKGTEKIIFKSIDPLSDKIFSAKVNKEVIVYSGTIGLLQVLMLSGIGPRESLEEHGIRVVHDLPGTDHTSISVAWEVPAAESLTSMAISPLRIALDS
ncbi:hypothetical protein OCU04_011197 [Sclerotinia nivalis]|uniref:Glucose-methanol-choline oxidoreductase N-terminal domain-containing protein n=1 Tax=Sclerotinia nivalis TaxID=352851 RepID=A0A9X0AB17_9HELO|nr:hypothetical protein OCU04_011197 [Sclerotinia nivalis]